MRTLWLVPVLAFGLILTPLQASAYNQDLATGQDWTERMSQKEKFMSLVPPAILFSEYDVHLKLRLPKYIYLIDRIMERNPRLQDEGIASIFASTIYLFEPENRQNLRNMEINFLPGNYNSPPATEPRLTIEEILSEVPPVES